MDRTQGIEALNSRQSPWDFVIIGGGATGLGCAVDAAARGYDTLLLEMHDFAKATSSRSTKLVHGGVRYLEQGNVSLVFEALKERERLQDNAPHLVSNLPFVVPSYKWWEAPYYGIGMKVYDLLAGSQNFGRSQYLNRNQTIERLPTVETDGLRGGILYFDGQFDDTRLAVNMAQTATEQGGVLINYMKATGLTKTNGTVDGVVAECQETDTTFDIEARSVINATGIFTDTIRQMDDPSAGTTLRPSRGTHIVLDKSFLPGDSAIMVPKTDDGRVLFAIPWHDRVVVGTTEAEVDDVSMEPTPGHDELDFLLTHAQRYLVKDPGPEDVLSVYAGIRPLVAPPGSNGDTSDISREHQLNVSESGLVTISGGKWTTYRKMAEDTIDRAARHAELVQRPSNTDDLRLHGWHQDADRFGDLALYGADAEALQDLMEDRPALREPLDERLPIRGAQVVWAARHEMARTVEDVLSRRTRCLLLDAQASIDVAPTVAKLMAEERGLSASWAEDQVDTFTEVASTYLMPSLSM
ncbi:glycerol-3-phosphate dehydrogenase/oxidase [Salinibacter altiplanensis]|uniref:glycerol-3-phosphate dehydrogenase/oxidase n=1 Tax=Salinibacter altiplanensis TaxID=1803181 RepID=UPI000C9EE25D|nr:glycerol-3-phosphate dehydrogenase/oxidase [Salinibacter altiplanensis]